MLPCVCVYVCILSVCLCVCMHIYCWQINDSQEYKKATCVRRPEFGSFLEPLLAGVLVDKSLSLLEPRLPNPPRQPPPRPLHWVFVRMKRQRGQRLLSSDTHTFKQARMYKQTNERTNHIASIMLPVFERQPVYVPGHHSTWMAVTGGANPTLSNWPDVGKCLI